MEISNVTDLNVLPLWFKCYMESCTQEVWNNEHICIYISAKKLILSNIDIIYQFAAIL